MTDRAISAVSRHETLMERANELATLRVLIEAAGSGDAKVALVEGPAGIGKSRLLAELRGAAEAAGMRVLSARGADLERAFPFGVVRQLFEPLVAIPEEQERCCAGAAASAAAVFGMPDLDYAGQDASFAALHGLYWLTLNVAAERPLALVVDDLHWCDVPSLRFLAYLVRRLEGQPVLIATGLRTAEPGADPVLLGEIAGDPLTVQIRPAALTVDAVGELVRDRLSGVSAPEFVAACHEATGGNPLLLHELLKTLAAESVEPAAASVRFVRELGSRAISRSVLVRLARLGQPASAVARAVAVLGDDTDLGMAAALAEVDDRTAAEATRELTRAEILRPGLSLGFVHPLVRDAVYDDLAPGERGVLHVRAIEILRAAGVSIEQVAAHWLILPRRGDPEVGTALQTAGRISAQQGAPDSAVAYFRRALEEPLDEEQRIRVLLDLGMTEADVNVQSAARHIRAAYAELRDPAERAQVAELLTRQLLFAESGEQAAAVARAALEELPAGFADLRQRLQAMELMSVNFGASEPDLEAKLGALGGEIRSESAGARMLQAVVAFELALACRPASTCVPMALEALADGSLITADPGIATIVAICVLVLGDRPEPLRIWEDVRAVAHRGGSLEAAVGMELWRGWTLYHLGELQEAEESLRQAMEHEASWVLDTGTPVIFTSAFLARTLVERGDAAGARQVLTRRGTPAPGADGALFGVLGEAHLLNAEGRFAEVIDLLDAQAPHLPRVDNPAWCPWRPLKARALASLGREPEAIGLMNEDLERARRWGTATPIGRALRILGELEGDEARLREAVEMLSSSPRRLEYAKALASLGRLKRLARRPREAREWLAPALEMAESCGSSMLAQHIRSELHAAGARPRSAAQSGPGSLTPSELRVAKLATEGRTNRDIAQELYVTPKTVEVHLSSAYRKLGIKSRAALGGALA